MSNVGDRLAKPCRDCGRVMWVIDLPDFGPLWQCATCLHSIDSLGIKHAWGRPEVKPPPGAKKTERKYRGRDACPRCGKGLWIVEVPHYGNRKQCEDCRISIVGGSIMEWRTART